MIKNIEKEMVKIAESKIEKVIDEWAKKPYLWESEADIHAELYLKIKNALSEKFPLREKYKYKGMTTKEYFDRVYCKSLITRGRKYQRKRWYPDIVIFKYKERDDGYAKDIPIWFCEIKYVTEWSSGVSLDNIRNDGKKLQRLLKQRADGTNATQACILVLKRNQWKSKNKQNQEEYHRLEIEEILKDTGVKPYYKEVPNNRK